jgi:hypothetical protein
LDQPNDPFGYAGNTAEHRRLWSKRGTRKSSKNVIIITPRGKSAATRNAIAALNESIARRYFSLFRMSAHTMEQRARAGQ